MKRLQAYPFRLGPDEDLKGRNMSRSAAGTLDQPGKNVRAKSGFNKSILDQGWFEFRRQVDYKLSWNGGWLVAVPPKNTSRECPCCGYVSADNRRTQSRFACMDCGFEENADVVGAINNLARGMKILRDEGQDTMDASLGCVSTARIACEVNDARGSSAAGTRRSGFWGWLNARSKRSKNLRPSGRGGCQEERL